MKEYILQKQRGVILTIKLKFKMAKTCTLDEVRSKAKKIRTRKGLELKIVNPDAADIDVSSRDMQVCVPLDRDADYNRKFGVFTEDLEAISRWLTGCCIKTVAMESTGVYWVPLYMKLLDCGIEVYLVNAKSTKNFVEEKTDEVDAESLGAIVATANKISKIVYTMVKTQTEYDESLIRINEPEYLMRKMKNMQKGIAVIQKQLEAYSLKSSQESGEFSEELSAKWDEVKSLMNRHFDVSAA